MPAPYDPGAAFGDNPNALPSLAPAAGGGPVLLSTADLATLAGQPTRSVFVPLFGPVPVQYRSALVIVPGSVQATVPESIYELLCLDGYIAPTGYLAPGY